MIRLATVATVLRKELLETVRDRRTLFMMLVLPTLLYPVMLVLVQQLALFGQRQLGAEPVRVAVAGAEPALVRFLDADPELRVFGGSAATPESVRARGVEAAVRVRPPAEAGGSAGAELLYDASSERSRRAREVVDARLRAWGDTLLGARLRDAGLPPSFARPLVVADSSVATAEETGGYALGRFLPVVLVLMTLLGAFYPAIDMAAGEKERGTLETLLTTAVPPREIVAGKFAAVSLVALAAAAANLGSMLLTFQSGLFRLAPGGEIRLSLPAGAALLVLLALVPLAVLFAAVFLGIAVRAQSFKEAQNSLTPVQLAAILPLLAVSLPGIDFTPVLALVPVVGIAMFFRELMAGTAPLLPSVLAFAATVGYALLALVFAARAFGREEVLFGAGGGEVSLRGGWLRGFRSAEGVPLPATAFAFVAAVGLLYFHLGGRFQGAWGERGLVASQWLLLALPAVLFAAAGAHRARAALALHAPAPRAAAAALLMAAGGIPVALLIGALQLHLFPGGAEGLGALESLLTPTDARRALWLLVVVALTPAICEELVFRGVLLQSLAREASAWRAILLSAVVFGAFHLSFETALRFLPTAFLGVLLGWAVWHARSVYAGMAMHFVNNAFVVLLLWQPWARGLVLREGTLAWPAVVAGAALLFAGIRLMPRRQPSTPEGE